MVATPITATTRYYPPGTRRVYYCAAIASKSAPTRSELDAGSDLTGEIASMTGFSTTSATVDVPDLGSRFTSQIPGAITAASSALEFYMSEDSQDVRELLPRDATGFIVIFWEGDTSGKKMDVFPVRVTTGAKDVTTTDPGKISIEFAITSEPAENVNVPS